MENPKAWAMKMEIYVTRKMLDGDGDTMDPEIRKCIDSDHW